ncbi:MAG TPA: transglutaminase domain-containing protein [Terriglobia bacterium]|nr:transglutaminase domain-containing protein [Terriglobia bacterium]
MKAKSIGALAGAFALAVALGAPSLSAAENPANARTFEFIYEVTLKPPASGTLKVWIPVATSDAHQQVTLQDISSPVPAELGRGDTYGNHLLYAEIKGGTAPVKISLKYQVTRDEYAQGGLSDLRRHESPGDPTPAEVLRFLEPDRLVPLNDRFQKMAADITEGQKDEVGKAYAIYDYVFHTLRYDKTGTGWGRGDAMWACDSKRGNCTDFHSLFIALMRAEKIPARFEIGFPLPATLQGDIPGYHCWAEFYLNGVGWVPVDISEAWQDPARHDYLFGSLDPNRVRFSTGRDLTLSPPQAGPPLNYFVYPYVELNGQPYDQFEKKFSFRDLTPPAGAGAH